MSSLSSLLLSWFSPARLCDCPRHKLALNIHYYAGDLSSESTSESEPSGRWEPPSLPGCGLTSPNLLSTFHSKLIQSQTKNVLWIPRLSTQFVYCATIRTNPTCDLCHFFGGKIHYFLFTKCLTFWKLTEARTERKTIYCRLKVRKRLAESTSVS